MSVVDIVKLISIIVGSVVSTLLPAVIAIVNANKKRKEAKTAAEKQAALNDMLNVVNQFIEGAEGLYKEVDALFKERGGTLGAVKKDSVMTKLQAYALSQGYTFDADYWSGKIDEIVALTRQVNAKHDNAN